MDSLWKPSEVCIGISLEGDLLRLAALGRKGKSLRVMDLASLTLPVAQPVHRDADESSNNPFDKFDSGDDDDTVYSAVTEFLNQHFVPNASLAVSLGEPNIRTFMMKVEEKDSPVKITKKILSEIQQSLHVELTRDMVAYSPINKTSVIAAARLESTPILDLLALPYGNSRKNTKITAVTSNDIALLNMVHGHFRFMPEEIVHVINVGKDETRIYILRGGDLIYIAPAVQQGSTDREFVTMLNNRIELAAENAGYPKADSVVLCGYAEDIGLKEEILSNNPNVVFRSLSRLRIGYSNDEKLAQEMRHYLVPISAAWAKLDPKSPHFYHISVVPQKIRDEQKVMKLAWHGVVLLLLLFSVATGLTLLALNKHMEIATLTEQLEYERKQMAEQQVIIDQINVLEQRSASVMNATNTLDTLLMNSEVWSETLDTLALAVGNLHDLWISEMKPEKDGSFSVIGYSITRASVPSISDNIGKTVMREIAVQEIGKKKLFRYDIKLNLDDAYPYSGSIATQWHDSIAVALGDVSTRLGIPAASEKPTGKEKKPGAKKKGGNK